MPNGSNITDIHSSLRVTFHMNVPVARCPPDCE